MEEPTARLVIYQCPDAFRRVKTPNHAFLSFCAHFIFPLLKSARGPSPPFFTPSSQHDLRDCWMWAKLFSIYLLLPLSFRTQRGILFLEFLVLYLQFLDLRPQPLDKSRYPFFHHPSSSAVRRRMDSPRQKIVFWSRVGAIS
jgi:hypothetical protein